MNTNTGHFIRHIQICHVHLHLSPVSQLYLYEQRFKKNILVFCFFFFCTSSFQQDILLCVQTDPLLSYLHNAESLFYFAIPLPRPLEKGLL